MVYNLVILSHIAFSLHFKNSDSKKLMRRHFFVKNPSNNHGKINFFYMSFWKQQKFRKNSEKSKMQNCCEPWTIWWLQQFLHWTDCSTEAYLELWVVVGSPSNVLQDQFERQLTINLELARWRGEFDCLIKTKHCDDRKRCWSIVISLPSALNVKLKKFNLSNICWNLWK